MATDATAVAVVTPEERAARERQGADLMTLATELVITEPKKFEMAAKWLREVVAPLKRQITETFRPRIEQAHALHKGLLADEKRFLGPVEDAERIVRGKLATWEQAEAQRRREAEAAAQRERERLEHEAREQAEAEQRRLTREAEDRRLAEAAQLEAAGDRAGADRLVSTPVTAPVVSPAPVFAPRPPVAAPPRVEGVNFRDDFDFVIENVDLLPREFMKPDDVKIRGVVRAMKGATRIPGVTVVPKRIASVRSAR